MGGKAILIVTIGLGFILGYISLNMSGMATRAVDNMSHYATATESHNLATIGANIALSKFYQDTSWFGTITQDLTGQDPGGSHLGHLTGSFTATMTNLGGGVARLRSISTYSVPSEQDLHDTVEVYFSLRKFNSFTLYAWMTDFEGNSDFWVTGDTIWGRMHSNGNLHVNGSPVFMEKVTAVKGFDPKPGVGANQGKYLQGYETGVAPIPFPLSFAELIAAAQGPQGKYYPGDVWLTLSAGTSANGDGKVFVRSTKTGPIIDSVMLNNPGFNGALLGGGRVNISGTLDGALTTGSLTDIYVQDNSIYANRNTRTTDDVLGLVANNNVVIADNLANRVNCEIDGSVFCLTGSFYTENINSGSTRGTMKVNGSIVQKTRGEIGKYSGSTLNKGYWDRYKYDNRLANPAFRPPFYPGYYVTTYSIANWWENVRIPNFVD